jgi:hypothetical protein
MIQRSLINEINKGLRFFPAVALLGTRQIGKSTLAQSIARLSRRKTLFLDLEKKSDLSRLADPETFLTVHKDNLVIIDEVQFMPELFTILRPVIDEYRKPGRFLLLGSASPHLVKGVSESLAGRIQYTELPPVNILEAESHKIEINTLWLRGGFPASLTPRTIAQSMEWRKQLVRSFVERDLAALFGTGITAGTVGNFWQMLSHQQGGIWNAHMFANSLGVTGPTAKRYLQFLHGAFLVRILEPWFVNATKRLVKSPKVFVRDTGLLHAMMNINSYAVLMGHPVAGASWEGFVIEQIIQLLPGKLRPFFYRTHHGAEADLMLVEGIKPVAAIEIKLTNAPVISKGFYQAIDDLKLKQGFVVTPGSESYPQKQMRVCSLKEFVKKFLPEL